MDRVPDQAHIKYAPLLLALSLALVLLASWIARNFSTFLGHDQVSYLYEANGFLSGYQIYGPHLSETNPPFIIWFSAIPVMLARHLSVSAVSWFRIIVLVSICFSTAWCVRLLQRSGKTRSGLGLAIYGFSVLIVESYFVGYNFGQREHLLIIFLLPYLLGVATGTVTRLSPVELCALGCTAGCAIWFKPQDIAIVVGLEVVCALCARSLRRLFSIEFISMVLTASLIFALVRWLTPLYMHEVLPLLSNTYWALGTDTFSSLLLGSRLYVAALLVTFVGYFLLRQRLVDRTTPVALLSCSVAGFIAYCVQHTKWSYHQYPHKALYLLALCSLVLDLFHPVFTRIGSSLSSGRLALAISGCAFIFIGVIALRPGVVGKRRNYLVSKPLNLFLDKVQPGTTVSALSTSVLVLGAVYDHGLRWGSRFAHLWMLPAIIQNEMGRTSSYSPFKQLSPQTTLGLAALQRKEVAEDLNYWHPDLVFVPICTRESNCQGIEGKDLDVLAWFEQSPEFLRAWSRYVRQSTIDGYDVYRLSKSSDPT